MLWFLCFLIKLHMLGILKEESDQIQGARIGFSLYLVLAVAPEASLQS